MNELNDFYICPPTIKNGILYCPYCSDENATDISDQKVGEFVRLEKLKIQGSRGLRVDNLKKWEKDGVDINQLPNSEWHNESYTYEKLECPECAYEWILTEEEPVILVSDDPFLQDDLGVKK